MITLFKDPFFQGFENVFESKLMRAPETNVSKNESSYVISVCIPGLTKEDLKISSKDSVLKISYEKGENEKSSFFVESFVKSYTIPDDVKEKDIEGKVENGILTLTLPIDKKKTLERLISLN